MALHSVQFIEYYLRKFLEIRQTKKKQAEAIETLTKKKSEEKQARTAKHQQQKLQQNKTNSHNQSAR